MPLPFFVASARQRSISEIPLPLRLVVKKGTKSDWRFSAGMGRPSLPIYNRELSPELQAAQYQMQASKHGWRQARASLFPVLSLSAGLNTAYNKTLHSETAASFRNQMKNNMGEFVGATLSIPLFNRLQSVTNIRKAKNKYKIAQETYAQKQLELEKLSREAWQDRMTYQKQTIQMSRSV